MYQISLVGAYIAGMVALFAPCCISYLLPTYFGNIFRERKTVLLMTVVYSAGILVVMLPVVLGAKVFADWLFRFHDQTYMLGSLLLMLVAVLALLGIKLPMPFVSTGGRGGSDVVSNFSLGVVSGITSACCAPVLIGVMALSGMSASLGQAVGVGVVYVLGMVSPLYIAAWFVEKGNILERPVWKRKLGMVTMGGRSYPVFVSNVVAFVVFMVMGSVLLALSLSGRLAMDANDLKMAEWIGGVAFGVDEWLGKRRGLDLLLLGGLGYGSLRIVRRVGVGKKKEKSCCKDKKVINGQ